MKLLLIVLLLTGCTSLPCDRGNFIRIGAGYKLDENPWINNSDRARISARMEAGRRCSGDFSYGIAHHSQWFVGWPIDSQDEYHKTEIFVDKEWNF